MTQVEKVAFSGWENCYKLSNGEIELIVTTDIGPRIMSFGFAGKDNFMAVFEESKGQTGGDEWVPYGGHRLWHAPEVKPRTYFPDNSPITLEEHDGFVRVTQPTEAATGIQKEIDISMSADSNQVKLVHRLTNKGVWDVDLAVWALTMVTTGGTAILPMPPRGSHTEFLAPVNALAMWAYTDMRDPRWTWGEKYILLRQDPNAAVPQKVGAMVTDNWIGYAYNDQLFVKTFEYVEGATYPDFGCTVETFTNNAFLEVETLSPMVKLAPGASAEHVEHWYMFDGVAKPENDADVDANVLPKVQTVL